MDLKYDVRAWTEFLWSKIGISGDSCEHGIEPSGRCHKIEGTYPPSE
jgi:hypothetical protein